jgi:hypothetical protein
MFFFSPERARLPLGPSQTSLEWAREFFPGLGEEGGGWVMRLEREFDHSHPSRTEVRKSGFISVVPL